MQLTPVENWPLGSRYHRVFTVYHSDRHGIMDPTIVERMVLDSEVTQYIAEQRRNPNATSYSYKSRIWRGVNPRG